MSWLVWFFVSGCWFSIHFFKTIMVSDAIAIIIGVPSCHSAGLVPAFWAPGGRFWQLGVTLRGKGSSRRDSLGSGVEFVENWDGIRDPVLKVFLARWNKVGILLSCLFPFFIQRFCSCEFVLVEF